MGIGRVFVVWFVLLCAYLLLAGATSINEIVAGVLACLLVACIVAVVHRGERRVLHVRPPVRVIGATLLSLLTDTIRVAARLSLVIMRRPAGRAGRLQPVPFRAGGDDPADAGRRGLVTLAASLAPNGFALALPEGRDLMLMHALVPRRPPADRDWPV